MPERSAHLSKLALCYALLAWIALGQYRIFDRLLFRDAEQYNFVLFNVQGVLDGHPISKSWQQRFLGPALIVALDRVTHDRLESLESFGGLMALFANLLLFAAMRRKGAGLLESLAIVAGFDFVHFLLAYKLEYPWDGIDILIFLGFGYWAARGGSLLALAPLLAIGLFNHETVLYVPFFYLLAWLVRAEPGPRARTQALFAVAFLAALALAIYVLRERYFLGAGHFRGATRERATPLLANHLHVEHNLRQLFVVNWREGRSFISLGVLASCASLLALAWKRPWRAPALFSLCVIASIVGFGYTNETRHYLLLVAFWFAYALPANGLNARRAASPPHSLSTETASP